MVNHNVCPLCYSGKIRLHHLCTDHFLTKEKFEVLRCDSCGFVFTNNYPLEKDIGRYYESDEYVSHDDSAKGFINRVYIAARTIMLAKKRKMIIRHLGKDKGNLLDIGCGTGYFTGMMKEHGWDVTGVESSRKAGEYASAKFGIKVIDPAMLSDLPGAGFDCITLWHVLEHFHDLNAYIHEIKRLLRPDGLIIIAIPNSSSSDSKYFGEFWAAWDVPRHLWHFDPITFRSFAEKQGLRLIKTQPLVLDVFYISILSYRYKGSHFPFINGILAGFVFSLRSVFRKELSSSLCYFLK